MLIESSMSASDRYAVFGNPIAHSRSPTIHTMFAEQTGQQLTYTRQLVEIGDFERSTLAFIESGGRGANVTLPFKIEAWAIADILTDRAQSAGAVNTLTFDERGIVGDNTDGLGFVTDLAVNAGIPIVDRRILLLGAGGAAQGVVLPLLQMRPASLVIANRTASKAIAIATRFVDLAHAPGVIQAAEFSELDGRFDIVINATAASLSSKVPEIPVTVFDASTFAYDMMYGPAPTAFMQLAAGRGATVRDGLGMLVEQAAEAFRIWRNVRPATSSVLRALRSSL